MIDGRDFFVDELLAEYRGRVVDPVPMPAEAPLFLMYTSGTTGRPKGCQHSTGGYLSYVAGTSKYYQDIHPEDTYRCAADIGWITGHSYIVYGPLALGTTSVMYEGVPAHPDAGRLWRIAERLGVTIFHRPQRSGCCASSARTRPPNTTTCSRLKKRLRLQRRAGRGGAATVEWALVRRLRRVRGAGTFACCPHAPMSARRPGRVMKS